jgi:hypothetical protein
MENNPSMPDSQPDVDAPKDSNVQVKSKATKHNLVFWLLAGLSIVTILGLAAWGFKQGSSLQQTKSEISALSADKEKLTTEVEQTKKEIEEIKTSTGEANVDKSGFQAVFLKSGQVYFGKITKITTTQLTLENIYYLRVNSGSTMDLDNLPQDTSLVKLGCELHGPDDKMFIERKEVEFWENIKKDGEVTKAIGEYEKAYPDGQKCD